MMTKNELRSTFSLGGIFGLRMLGLFMIFPVFSVFASQLPSVTPLSIGMALGIYGLTQALFQLPFGVWSDYTSRRQVIFIGLVIFAFGSIIAALSQSINGIILGRALQGAGAIGSTTIALVGDLTLAENRSKAMGIIGITIGFSFILGIAIGPLLAHYLGVRGLFWLTAVLAVAGMLVLWRCVPSPEHQSREFNVAIFQKQLKTILFDPILMRLNVSIFFAHAILMSFFVVGPGWMLSTFGLPVSTQGKVYLPILLLVIVLIGGLMRQKHFALQEKRWVKLCIAFIIISQAVLYNLTDLLAYNSILYFALFFFFFGFTFLEALLPSLVSQATSIDFRGSATGIFSTCQFLGIFVGGLLGGLLLKHCTALGVFATNVLIGLIWYGIMIPLRSHENLVKE
ncbi:MAG: MFS-family transporter [Gammaproteobacteria bacterium]|jgi:predicted MFS family arabinose efflux permease|nr:MFS-family transporter [Gammaproteobacteria bacterium]